MKTPSRAAEAARSGRKARPRLREPQTSSGRKNVARLASSERTRQSGRRGRRRKTNQKNFHLHTDSAGGGHANRAAANGTAPLTTAKNFLSVTENLSDRTVSFEPCASNLVLRADATRDRSRGVERSRTNLKPYGLAGIQFLQDHSLAGNRARLVVGLRPTPQLASLLLARPGCPTFSIDIRDRADEVANRALLGGIVAATRALRIDEPTRRRRSYETKRRSAHAEPHSTRRESRNPSETLYCLQRFATACTGFRQRRNAGTDSFQTKKARERNPPARSMPAGGWRCPTVGHCEIYGNLNRRNPYVK